MRIASLVILALLLTRNAAPVLPPLPRPLRGFPGFVCCCAAVVVPFIASLVVDLVTGDHVRHGVALPFATVAIPFTQHPLASDVATIAWLLETAGLVALLVRLREGGLGRREDAVLIACVVLAVGAALVLPVLRSDDVYFYAGYTAFADPLVPQQAPFRGDFAPVNATNGYPLMAWIYGPAWLGVSRFGLGWLPALVERLYGFRAIGLGGVAVAALAYARLRDRRTALALFALNPTLLGYDVLDAHNDAWGIAFVLLAMLPRTSPWLRFVLCVAAGSLKYTFLVAGAAVFASLPKRAWRFGVPLAVAATTALVALLTGRGFVSGVSYLAARRAFDPVSDIPQIVLFVACLGFFAYALATQRFVRFGGASTVSLALTPMPWYLAWGIPYEIAGSTDREYLVALPLLSLVVDNAYDATPLREGAVFVVLIAILFAVLRLGPFRKRAAAPA